MGLPVFPLSCSPRMTTARVIFQTSSTVGRLSAWVWNLGNQGTDTLLWPGIIGFFVAKDRVGSSIVKICFILILQNLRLILRNSILLLQNPILSLTKSHTFLTKFHTFFIRLYFYRLFSAIASLLFSR